MEKSIVDDEKNLTLTILQSLTETITRNENELSAANANVSNTLTEILMPLKYISETYKLTISNLLSKFNNLNRNVKSLQIEEAVKSNNDNKLPNLLKEFDSIDDQYQKLRLKLEKVYSIMNTLNDIKTQNKQLLDEVPLQEKFPNLIKPQQSLNNILPNDRIKKENDRFNLLRNDEEIEDEEEEESSGHNDKNINKIKDEKEFKLPHNNEQKYLNQKHYRDEKNHNSKSSNPLVDELKRKYRNKYFSINENFLRKLNKKPFETVIKLNRLNPPQLRLRDLPRNLRLRIKPSDSSKNTQIITNVTGLFTNHIHTTINSELFIAGELSRTYSFDNLVTILNSLEELSVSEVQLQAHSFFATLYVSFLRCEQYDSSISDKLSESLLEEYEILDKIKDEVNSIKHQKNKIR